MVLADIMLRDGFGPPRAVFTGNNAPNDTVYLTMLKHVVSDRFDKHKTL